MKKKKVYKIYRTRGPTFPVSDAMFGFAEIKPSSPAAKGFSSSFLTVPYLFFFF